MYELIARFQALKEITGTNKMSSYGLSLHFDPWSDNVTLEWGCYDVGNYPRHYNTRTTRQDLLAHMRDEIEKMEKVVKEAPNEEA